MTEQKFPARPISTEEMESSLKKLLSRLESNRKNVPLEILKTTYKEPYWQLMKQIKKDVEDYIKCKALTGIILSPDDLEEQYHLVNEVIVNSGLLKKISHATFKHYNMDEIKSLTIQIREQIKIVIWPYLEQHSYLCIDSNNLTETPKIYNTVLNAFYENGQWIETPNKPTVLLYIKITDNKTEVSNTDEANKGD